MNSPPNENIQVCVRMRPLLKPHEDDIAWQANETNNTISTVENLPNPLDSINLNIMKEREIQRRLLDILQPYNFNFDNVFGINSSSQQIYFKMVRPIVRSAIQGYNGTVFMYGQTTSGKTYTMLGNLEKPGILPCTLRDVFLAISKDSERSYTVWVSYIEIYNESLNDLLYPGSTNLKLKEDYNKEVQVQNLKRIQVTSFDQAIQLMNFGEENRSYKETSLHEHSSRSHTIYQIIIESHINESNLKKSTMNLVDLAGSERLNEFEAKSEGIGETGFINKSLFVLSNVISKLAERKQNFIPYRDSKLTRILASALGGNSLTAIISTISPAIMNFNQTLSTLRFALRAKVVKNRPQINEINDQNSNKSNSVLTMEINKLKNELKNANIEIKRLNEQNNQIQKSGSINSNILTKKDLNSSEKSEKNKENTKEENFIEGLIQCIELSIHHANSNKSWLEENQKLISSYKIDLLNLQNKYRDSLREICQKLFPENQKDIYVFLATAKAHSSPIAQADECIVKEIDLEIIFNEINLNNIKDFNVKSSNDNPLLLSKFEEIKENLYNKLDETYEAAKFKLESYYRNLVKKVKETILKGEIVDIEENTMLLTRITNEHHDLLLKLRQLYEDKLNLIEESYQNKIKQIYN